jgi:hypothetical protein
MIRTREMFSWREVLKWIEKCEPDFDYPFFCRFIASGKYFSQKSGLKELINLINRVINLIV